MLATQTLLQHKPKTFEIRVQGRMPFGVTAKDIILYLIGRISTSGGTGYCIEYTGEAILRARHGRADDRLQHDDRGRRPGGLDRSRPEDLRVSPGPPLCAQRFFRRGRALEKTAQRPGAKFDRTEIFQAADIEPQVTWGTNPGQVVSISGAIPHPSDFTDVTEQKAVAQALHYMDLKPGTPIEEIKIDRAFIGSCTNGRIEDLRAAATVVRGHKIAPTVHAMVVPGSGLVKKQAEAEGLDKIFLEAGLEWREAGCSMCLAMNPDKLEPGERCASTSNRNFEGRQGKGGRTHLVSPAMAAAASIAGKFVDIRDWEYK